MVRYFSLCFLGLLFLFSIEIYAWTVVVSLFRKLGLVANETVLPISISNNGFANEGYMENPASYDLF